MVNSNLLLHFLLLLLTVFYGVSAFNVTEILNSDPNLSDFNSYLTRTKLADEINSRSTITVLALSNDAISALSGNSTAAIKNILSIHVLLDFFDDVKLHDFKVGSLTTATTLYQTTGVAQDKTGQVNITVAKGGDIGFISAQPTRAGLKPGPVPKLVKEISHVGFKVSVLEISEPIIVPSLLTSGPPDVNITAVVESGGCRRFADMIVSTGVVKTYMKQMIAGGGNGGGVTVFAPKDEAFTAKGAPNFANLSSADLVSLLLFHALDSYAPITTLKSAKGELKTLAPAGNYGVNVTPAEDYVRLNTGINTAKVVATLKDEIPVAVYAIDAVLLPEELFGNSTAPSAAPEPAPAPHAPAPTPTPSPKAKPPSSKAKPPSPAKAPYASPPAPPADVDGGDGGSGGDSDGPSTSDDGGNPKNGGMHRNVSLLLSVIVLVLSFVI